MNALYYAHLAQLVYSMPPTFGAEDSACRAISKITADGMTMGFPGTNNAATVLADIDVDVLEIEGLGAIHEGFWRAYSSQRTKLLAIGADVIYGHSEGAALALLYAADLCLHNKPPAAIYAFEPPRVSADNRIRDLFLPREMVLLLTRNGDDPVTEVPNLMHSWRQPWQLTHIGQDSILEAIEDHLIENVIHSVAAMNPGP